MSAKQIKDIELEVVDNGFVAKIGDKTFVFGDIDAVDEWIKDNFGTPTKARKSIKSIKGTNDNLFGEFDPFTTRIIQPNVNPYVTPNTSPNTIPQWTTTCTTGDPGLITYGTVHTYNKEKTEEEV